MDINGTQGLGCAGSVFGYGCIEVPADQVSRYVYPAEGSLRSQGDCKTAHSSFCHVGVMVQCQEECERCVWIPPGAPGGGPFLATLVLATEPKSVVALCLKGLPNDTPDNPSSDVASGKSLGHL